jgi:hypothetical protein
VNKIAQILSATKSVASRGTEEHAHQLSMGVDISLQQIHPDAHHSGVSYFMNCLKILKLKTTHATYCGDSETIFARGYTSEEPG